MEQVDRGYLVPGDNKLSFTSQVALVTDRHATFIQFQAS